MKTLLIFDQLLEEIEKQENVKYGFYSESEKRIHTTSYGRESIITDFDNFNTINLCYENDFNGSIKSKSFFFHLNPELFNFNMIVTLDTRITKRPNSGYDNIELLKLGLMDSIAGSNTGEGSLVSNLILVSKRNAHPTYFVSRSIELAQWNTCAELRRPGTLKIFTVGCPFCGRDEAALNRNKNIFDVITDNIVKVLLEDEQDSMSILSFVDELNDWADSVEDIDQTILKHPHLTKGIN